ncbi:hypothetical protein HYH02_012588 [Chlamydomonas schloesseri]|uniref:Ion transport domain-containing protein n=1 Tax=Chlamydomonas schloesseri TaxID=2026947 RepID=A0A835W1D9_9CHLO|nr:hypothetical protein HYH02_012588 [Chlamydomonas schloesseri]|eukprot:KAG2433469.1 hypothetical protein HYH02_012588 [Chlamydomonas schloesseri]
MTQGRASGVGELQQNPLQALALLERALSTSPDEHKRALRSVLDYVRDCGRTRSTGAGSDGATPAALQWADPPLILGPSTFDSGLSPDDFPAHPRCTSNGRSVSATEAGQRETPLQAADSHGGNRHTPSGLRGLQKLLLSFKPSKQQDQDQEHQQQQAGGDEIADAAAVVAAGASRPGPSPSSTSSPSPTGPGTHGVAPPPDSSLPLATAREGPQQLQKAARRSRLPPHAEYPAGQLLHPAGGDGALSQRTADSRQPQLEVALSIASAHSGADTMQCQTGQQQLPSSGSRAAFGKRRLKGMLHVPFRCAGPDMGAEPPMAGPTSAGGNPSLTLVRSGLFSASMMHMLGLMFGSRPPTCSAGNRARGASGRSYMRQEAQVSLVEAEQAAAAASDYQQWRGQTGLRLLLSGGYLLHACTPLSAAVSVAACMRSSAAAGGGAAGGCPAGCGAAASSVDVPQAVGGSELVELVRQWCISADLVNWTPSVSPTWPSPQASHQVPQQQTAPAEVAAPSGGSGCTGPGGPAATEGAAAAGAAIGPEHVQLQGLGDLKPQAAVAAADTAGASAGADCWVSPLAAAALHGDVELVRLLLEKGADPNGRCWLPDGTVFTPLMVARIWEVARELLVAQGVEERLPEPLLLTALQLSTQLPPPGGLTQHGVGVGSDGSGEIGVQGPTAVGADGGRECPQGQEQLQRERTVQLLLEVVKQAAVDGDAEWERRRQQPQSCAECLARVDPMLGPGIDPRLAVLWLKLGGPRAADKPVFRHPERLLPPAAAAVGSRHCNSDGSVFWLAAPDDARLMHNKVVRQGAEALEAAATAAGAKQQQPQQDMPPPPPPPLTLGEAAMLSRIAVDAAAHRDRHWPSAQLEVLTVGSPRHPTTPAAAAAASSIASFATAAGAVAVSPGGCVAGPRRQQQLPTPFMQQQPAADSISRSGAAYRAAAGAHSPTAAAARQPPATPTSMLTFTSDMLSSSVSSSSQALVPKVEHAGSSTFKGCADVGCKQADKPPRDWCMRYAALCDIPLLSLELLHHAVAGGSSSCGAAVARSAVSEASPALHVPPPPPPTLLALLAGQQQRQHSTPRDRRGAGSAPQQPQREALQRLHSTPAGALAAAAAGGRLSPAVLMQTPSMEAAPPAAAGLSHELPSPAAADVAGPSMTSAFARQSRATPSSHVSYSGCATGPAAAAHMVVPFAVPSAPTTDLGSASQALLSVAAEWWVAKSFGCEPPPGRGEAAAVQQKKQGAAAARRWWLPRSAASRRQGASDAATHGSDLRTADATGEVGVLVELARKYERPGSLFPSLVSAYALLYWLWTPAGESQPPLVAQSMPRQLMPPLPEGAEPFASQPAAVESMSYWPSPMAAAPQQGPEVSGRSVTGSLLGYHAASMPAGVGGGPAIGQVSHRTAVGLLSDEARLQQQMVLTLLQHAEGVMGDAAVAYCRLLAFHAGKTLGRRQDQQPVRAPPQRAPNLRVGLSEWVSGSQAAGSAAADRSTGKAAGVHAAHLLQSQQASPLHQSRPTTAASPHCASKGGLIKFLCKGALCWVHGQARAMLGPATPGIACAVAAADGGGSGQQRQAREMLNVAVVLIGAAQAHEATAGGMAPPTPNAGAGAGGTTAGAAASLPSTQAQQLLVKLTQKARSSKPAAGGGAAAGALPPANPEYEAALFRAAVCCSRGSKQCNTKFIQAAVSGLQAVAQVAAAEAVQQAAAAGQAAACSGVSPAPPANEFAPGLWADAAAKRMLLLASGLSPGDADGVPRAPGPASEVMETWVAGLRAMSQRDWCQDGGYAKEVDHWLTAAGDNAGGLHNLHPDFLALICRVALSIDSNGMLLRRGIKALAWQLRREPLAPTHQLQMLLEELLDESPRQVARLLAQTGLGWASAVQPTASAAPEAGGGAGSGAVSGPPAAAVVVRSWHSIMVETALGRPPAALLEDSAESSHGYIPIAIRLPPAAGAAPAAEAACPHNMVAAGLWDWLSGWMRRQDMHMSHPVLPADAMSPATSGRIRKSISVVPPLTEMLSGALAPHNSTNAAGDDAAPDAGGGGGGAAAQSRSSGANSSSGSSSLVRLSAMLLEDGGDGTQQLDMLARRDSLVSLWWDFARTPSALNDKSVREHLWRPDMGGAVPHTFTSAFMAALAVLCQGCVGVGGLFGLLYLTSCALLTTILALMGAFVKLRFGWRPTGAGSRAAGSQQHHAKPGAAGEAAGTGATGGRRRTSQRHGQYYSVAARALLLPGVTSTLLEQRQHLFSAMLSDQRIPLETWGMPGIAALVLHHWQSFTAHVVLQMFLQRAVYTIVFSMYALSLTGTEPPESPSAPPLAAPPPVGMGGAASGMQSSRQDSGLAGALGWGGGVWSYNEGPVCTGWPSRLHIKYIAVLMYMSLEYLVVEVRQMRMGFYDWFRQPWNLFDAVQQVLMFTSLSLHLSCTASVEVLQGLDQVLVLVLFWRLLYFATGKRGMGSFVRMVMLVSYDLRLFFIFLAVVYVGFGVAIMVVAPDWIPNCDQGGDCNMDVGRGQMVFLRLYSMIYGDFDATLLLRPGVASSGLAKLTSLVAALYMLFVSIILLNLLIAIVGDAYERVLESEGATDIRNKANMIVEVEQLMPGWLRKWRDRVLLRCDALLVLQNEDAMSVPSGEVAAREAAVLGQTTQQALQRPKMEHANSFTHLLFRSVDGGFSPTTPAGPGGIRGALTSSGAVDTGARTGRPPLAAARPSEGGGALASGLEAAAGAAAASAAATAAPGAEADTDPLVDREEEPPLGGPWCGRHGTTMNALRTLQHEMQRQGAQQERRAAALLQLVQRQQQQMEEQQTLIQQQQARLQEILQRLPQG